MIGQSSETPVEAASITSLDQLRDHGWPLGSFSTKISTYVEHARPATPCLVLDLNIVAERYQDLATKLPDTAVYYAVKANPEPAVIALLAHLGSCFDVASPMEIELCMRAGVAPEALSYGNTIKKRSDIRFAFERGVRLFAIDSLGELKKVAEEAPASGVFCRILTTGRGADWPLNRKFGCTLEMAADLLVCARDLGLSPRGVSFHVGSQQRDVGQWDLALTRVREVFDRAASEGVHLNMVNLGGGFPARYLEDIPPIEAYTEAIRAAVASHFGDRPPRLIVEPGRYIVGDAGVLLSEVILVSRKGYDEQERWVYLDVGVFGGLAETLDEAIRYRIVTKRHGGPIAPVVLAGPTCDSVDVLYEKFRYQLPLDLQPGDILAVLSAGAYTKTYCTDGFNGFQPMPVHCLPLIAARKTI